MNAITDFMEKDHERLHDIFKKFLAAKKGDGEKARALFGEFKTGLQRHIVWEEDILFPVFEERAGMYDSGPTAVMRIEHRQIKGFLEDIHDQLQNEKSQTEDLETGLFAILESHNRKEEQILYPWIDNYVDDPERKALFGRMKDLPQEKYCRCCEK